MVKDKEAPKAMAVSLDDVISAAFLCGLEQTTPGMRDEEKAHRIGAFEHSKGFAEIKEVHQAGLEQYANQRVLEELQNNVLKSLVGSREPKSIGVIWQRIDHYKATINSNAENKT